MQTFEQATEAASKREALEARCDEPTDALGAGSSGGGSLRHGLPSHRVELVELDSQSSPSV
jgi:hypothetical protein